MRRLCVVDLGAIFWTCWHSSADDELSAARERTVRMVNRLTHADDYDLVAICLDSPKSKRRESVDTYKAQRPPKPPQSLEQMRRTHEELEALGYHMFTADGWEGDDVVACFVRWARAQGDVDVTIVGVDKDFFQLLGPGVELHKFSDDTYFGEDDLLKKLEIKPSQVVDWLSVMGDKADNIEGVKGCGAKKAAKLLNDVGDIEAIRKQLREQPTYFTPALREALINASIGGESSPLSIAQRLVKLHDDVLPPEDYDRLLQPMTPKPRGEPVPDMPPPPDEKWADERIADSAPDAVPDAVTVPPSEPEKSTPLERLVERGAAAFDKLPEGPEDPKPSEPEQSVALARRDALRQSALSGPFSRRLEPRDLQQAKWIADMVNQSRLCSKKLGSAEACLMVIMAGAERGLGVWAAIQSTHVIEGSLAWHAHYIIAEAKKHPECEYFYLQKGSDEKSATYITKRRGTPEEESITATIEDAKVAGLLERRGSNWKRIPKAMLRKAAGVELARAVYPETTMGLYSPEEVSDGRIVEAEFDVEGT